MQRGTAGVKVSWRRALATPLVRLLRNRLQGDGGSGYHRRSRLETKMHSVKLLAQRRIARDFDR